MNRRERQKGMSVFGLMMLAVVLGFAGLIGLKLFPVYMEAMKVDSALSGMVADPDTMKAAPSKIRDSLVKRLELDDVRAIHHGNKKDVIIVTKNKDKVSVQVTWRTETPVFANISIVAAFDKMAQN